MKPWWAAFAVMIGALVLLALTGAVRANYTGMLGGSPSVRGRRQIVLVKHSVFLAVFALATVVAISALRA